MYKNAFILLLLATGLFACSNYYGYDKQTWQSMSATDRQFIINKSQAQIRKMQEGNQHQDDLNSTIDWSGKGPN